ncbi:MAG: hypothetical protein KF777_16150 [Planctomycetaceae bacterium]|jgi:hypothetical protein|nr:hypothetical protein [Planctomycetaceae bacterium]
MSSAIMLDRGALGQAGFTTPGAQPVPAQGANWCVVPRCSIEIEQCADGCKIKCCCDDDIACATLQNLCRMLAGGQCSVCCQLNGVTVLDCKFTCCHCKCEMTEDGCCITCCSGDTACCEMVQACCEAIACCVKNGCCCYVCFNGTPVCCCC